MPYERGVKDKITRHIAKPLDFYQGQGSKDERQCGVHMHFFSKAIYL
jgi:hypothetical protein